MEDAETLVIGPADGGAGTAALVWLHGLGDSPAGWAGHCVAWARALAEQGLKVVLPQVGRLVSRAGEISNWCTPLTHQFILPAPSPVPTTPCTGASAARVVQRRGGDDVVDGPDGDPTDP